MIFKNLVNASSQVQDVATKLQDKFTLQDVSMIPIGKLFKLSAISDDITKIARKKIAINEDVQLNELVDIMVNHLGEDVRKIDFEHFGLSDVEKLADILGISEANREKILKRFLGA